MEGPVKKSKIDTRTIVYTYIKSDKNYMGKQLSAVGAYFGDKDPRNFVLQAKCSKHKSILSIPLLKRIFLLIDDEFPVHIICNYSLYGVKSMYWDDKFEDIRTIIKKRNINLIYNDRNNDNYVRNLAQPFVYLNIKNQANGLIPTFQQKQKIKMIARCNAWICCARKMNICKDIRQKICKIVYFDSEDDLF